jgi:ADP-ribosylglycohydrolase
VLSPPAARERALGAFYGLALGDALGMPTQFLPRSRVGELYGVLSGFEPGPPDNEISAGLPAGRVTDDTDQAVIVAQTLIQGAGTVDPHALAERLLDWERDMVATGSADLLGPSTRRALTALQGGHDVATAGRWGDTNGAAMRVTPVGIAFPPEPLTALCDAVAEASRLTHATGLAISGACAVAGVVSSAIEGADLPAAIRVGVAAAEIGATHGHYIAGADVAARIRWAVRLVSDADHDTALDLVESLVGTGVATQEAVPAAFALLSRWGDEPWRACLCAAGLGGDSDTIAAMTGAMAGAGHGLSGFPAAALDVVRTVNDLQLDGLVDRLLTLRQVG